MPKRKSKETKVIEVLLKEHFPDYPQEYPPAAYRYNPASIRVRLVHEGFRGISRLARRDLVLPLIRTLPDKIRSDIMLLLLYTPEELAMSAGNWEFEHPTPPTSLDLRPSRNGVPTKRGKQ